MDIAQLERLSNRRVGQVFKEQILEDHVELFYFVVFVIPVGYSDT